MALSGPTRRAAVLLALLFVAAIVAGYVAFAVYSTLRSGDVPALQLLGMVVAALGLLVLVGGQLSRRR